MFVTRFGVLCKESGLYTRKSSEGCAPLNCIEGRLVTGGIECERLHQEPNDQMRRVVSRERPVFVQIPQDLAKFLDGICTKSGNYLPWNAKRQFMRWFGGFQPVDARITKIILGISGPSVSISDLDPWMFGFLELK